MSMIQNSFGGPTQGNPYQGQRSLYGGMQPMGPQGAPQGMYGGPQGMSGMPQSMQGMSGMAPPSQGMGASMPSGGYNPAPTGQYAPQLGGPQMGGMGQQPQINQAGGGPQYGSAQMGRAGFGSPPGYDSFMAQRLQQAMRQGGMTAQPNGQPFQNFGGGSPGTTGGAPHINQFSGAGGQQMPQMGSGPQMSPGPVAAGGFSPYQQQQMQSQQTGQGIGQTSGMPQQGGYAGGGNSGNATGSANFGGMGGGSLASMDPSQFGPAQQFLNNGGQFTRQNGSPQVNPFAGNPTSGSAGPSAQSLIGMSGGTGQMLPGGGIGASASPAWQQQNQANNGQIQDMVQQGIQTRNNANPFAPGMRAP